MSPSQLWGTDSEVLKNQETPYYIDFNAQIDDFQGHWLCQEQIIGEDPALMWLGLVYVQMVWLINLVCKACDKCRNFNFPAFPSTLGYI